jgi:hypothetical protein
MNTMSTGLLTGGLTDTEARLGRFAPCRAISEASLGWGGTHALLASQSLAANPGSIWLSVESDTLVRLHKPLMQLERLANLEENWDSYGGRPVSPRAVWRSVELIVRILESNADAPSIVPTSEGGIQLEWHPTEADLELIIHPDGTVDAYLETGSGQTWEGPLADSKWQIESFLEFVADRSTTRT